MDKTEENGLLREKEQIGSSYNEVEVTLAALIDTILRRKLFIIGTIIVSLLIGTIYIYTSKPIYESTTIIKIGQVKVRKDFRDEPVLFYLELPPVLVKRLMIQTHIDINSGAYLAGATYDKKDAKNIVTLSARASSPEAARNFIKKVTGTLLETHSRIYESLYQERIRYLTVLENNLSMLSEQIAQNTNIITSLQSEADTRPYLLAIENTRLLKEKISIMQGIHDMKVSLSEMNSINTEILKEPSINSAAVTPKKKTILTLSLVLGVFLGLLIGFIAEFYSRYKKHIF